ncbi:hypothetical protein [Pelagibaculum spongiae]|uniref:hypothetical protein n=1 Tax=Pelagibaculum spongiae TaxID=2080658 RepID=UPI00105781F9|nr:hypothetical protein [Pelagibaculum spongiae]
MLAIKLVGASGGALSGRGWDKVVSRTAIAAVIGGTSSAITGGKFASGAVSAAMSWMYNCERHGCGQAINQSKDSNGYSVSHSANGKSISVRYSGRCGTADCLMYGGNVNQSDPGYLEYAYNSMIELNNKIYDAAGFFSIFFPASRPLFSVTMISVVEPLHRGDLTNLTAYGVGYGLASQLTQRKVPIGVAGALGNAAAYATGKTVEMDVGKYK